jgi:hypothetical protein
MVLLEYTGEVVFDTIECLLSRLKELAAFRAMGKSTQKRVYSVFVECVDNLYKHRISVPISINGKRNLPYIILTSEEDKYIISTGNVVANDSIQELSNNLEQINQSDKQVLKSSYAEIADKEIISEEDGAGLGLITMALKTDDQIYYKFSSINDLYSYFEMRISI